MGRVVAIAFGSNLGDRRGNILTAVDEVGRILTNFALSPLIETLPVGPGLERDPLYLNAVGVGESTAPARELLAELLAIEVAAGRTRPHSGAPRIIDLDLVLAGDDVIDEPDLQVPHPRFRERRFVLEPLAEIAPEAVEPRSGATVSELLEALERHAGL